MINFLKKIFGKKDEEPNFGNHFALIRLTDIAKSQGIKDDQNKFIARYENGRLVKTYPYSKQMVESLKENFKIAVEEDGYVDEDFEFDTVGDFGVVRSENG